MGFLNLGDLPKKKDLGLGGVIIIISQCISAFQVNKNVSQQLQDFKEELHQTVVERERYFLRKTDLVNLSEKVDRMSDELIRLGDEVASLKSVVEENYASNYSGDIIGCTAQIVFTPEQNASLKL